MTWFPKYRVRKVNRGISEHNWAWVLEKRFFLFFHDLRYFTGTGPIIAPDPQTLIKRTRDAAIKERELKNTRVHYFNSIEELIQNDELRQLQSD